MAAAAAADSEAAASAGAAARSVAAVRREAGEMLSESDHKRIGAAIEATEAKTSGDIYCIVAQEASNYREVPLAWAAIAALVVPPLALAAGLSPSSLLRAIEGWSTVQASAA